MNEEKSNKESEELILNDEELRILVKKSDSEFVGPIKIESGHTCLNENEDTKLVIEIDRWINAICNVEKEPKKLESLSRALHDLHRTGNKRSLARTVRMLLFFEALFVKPEIPKPLVPGEFLEKTDLLLEQCPELKDAVKAIRSVYIPLDSTWYVWFPLLITAALVESQCEYFRPVLWEAYSAGRARDEFRRKWKNIIKDKSNRLLDIISMLIRFQSAAGQLTRRTGNAKFLKFAEQKSNDSFTKDNLINALRIIAIVEEARNHKLPGVENNPAFGEFPVNEGVNREWDAPTWFKVPDSRPKDIDSSTWDKLKELKGSIFRKRLNLQNSLEERLKGDAGTVTKIMDISGVDTVRNVKAIFHTLVGRNHTWCFASGINVSETAMTQFKKFFESDFYEFIKGYPTQLNIDKVAAFSFGRSQVEDLRTVLSTNVIRVVQTADNEKKAVFKENFYARVISIPNWDEDVNEPEFVVEILLKDEIAAKELLLGERTDTVNIPSHLPKNGGTAIGPTAGDLFSHLFEYAQNVFNLEQDAMRRGQSLYVPFPLLHRMLNIVYRLRPETCLTVSITFDDQFKETVHLPQHLKVDDHKDVIEIITNFVPAVVLNRGMSVGFKNCDIAFSGFTDSSGNHDAVNSAVMSVNAWKQGIMTALRENGYEVFVEKYLGDYNKERRNVQFRENRPSALKAIAIYDLLKELKTYSDNSKKGELYFLGIDIGGTFTKFQCYSIDFSGAKYVPIAHSFRMLTPNAKEDVPNGGKKLSALDFAEAIVNTIRKNISGKNDMIFKNLSAVGISWPGAVRGNQIAGGSGILNRFYSVKNVFMDIDIKDILRLEIARAFRKVWETTMKKEAPFVALLNDGSAEGIGAIGYLARTNESSLKERLAVVKIGTGTAGAVFSQGVLDTGLSEWGKILLDVAAARKQAFPEGVANLHLSKKTMPILANKRQPELFLVNELDSLELGMLLEASQDGTHFISEELKKLRWECGIREFAKTGMQKQLDAEVLRQVLKKGRKSEPELFQMIERSLVLIGGKAERKLMEQVGTYGIIRLADFLSLKSAGDEISKAIKHTSTMDTQVKRKLTEAYNVAFGCATSLGNYLGDFLVLLYDIYRMDTVVLGGGVLSKKTGELAISQAGKRMKMYGLDLITSKSDSTMKGKQIKCLETSSDNSGENLDFGTMGAAMFAAGEFLLDLRQKGLKEIETHLMKLRTNDNIEIHIQKVTFSGTRESVDLKTYSLDENSLEAYLEMYGTDLGFYKSSSGESDEPIVYTRW